MEDLVNNAPVGLVEFADDGTVLAANATFTSMLGHEPDVWHGRRFESFLSVGGRIFYQTHVFPLLRLHGKADEIYLALRSAAAEAVPVLLNAVRRERGGSPVNYCALMPIYQRSRYEDEILLAKKAAEDATRSKDEFLAMVSHELRTPLNAILGWAKMAQSGKMDDAELLHALQVIERNARTQSQLIEDLLDFSRIISGKLRIEVARLWPADVIQAAIDVVRPAADAKEIRIRPVLDQTAGPIAGDPDRLQQVVWNLLSNAVKFTPKGGLVQVRLERVNSHLDIVVADSGQGISPDFLPYVFDRFRQAGSRSTSRGGLGLGMAISRQIVELHGGTIRAESPGEGKGSAFTVELPVLSVYAAEDRSDAETQEWGEGDDQLSSVPRLDGIRVLVIDDERDARDLLVAVLIQSGAAVTAADTAADALARIHETRPDVLVSDVEMPDEGGYSLIKKVRTLEAADLRMMPAIALTARARYADRMRALLAGFQVHVPKPVDPAELVTLIANLCKRN